MFILSFLNNIIAEVALSDHTWLETRKHNLTNK